MYVINNIVDCLNATIDLEFWALSSGSLLGSEVRVFGGRVSISTVVWLSSICKGKRKKIVSVMGVFDKYVKSFLVSQPGVGHSITDWSVVCWCLGWRNQSCSNHVERSEGDSSSQVDTTNSNIANFTDRGFSRLWSFPPSEHSAFLFFTDSKISTIIIIR